MNYQLLALPVISAFIGYITNVIAIRLLFWPKRPINLGFFSVQGVLPKRQAQLAASVGELVENELLSMDELLEKINTPEIREALTDRIGSLIKERFSELLPRIVPAKIGKLVGELLEKVLRQEASNILRQIFLAGSEYLNKEIDIKQMVEDKINAFDLDELEKMIRGVSASELTFIEVLGGVLGFIIGLVQVAILLLFPMI